MILQSKLTKQICEKKPRTIMGVILFFDCFFHLFFFLLKIDIYIFYCFINKKIFHKYD
jgi:hypothetical protein